MRHFDSNAVTAGRHPFAVVTVILIVTFTCGFALHASARCVTQGTVVTCDDTAPNPWTSTIGSFRENGWSVYLGSGAQLVVGDTNAIALSSNATIVLGAGSLVQNTPVRGAGLAGGGSETIVLNRGGSITIEAGARLIDAGFQQNSSSIEVLNGGVRVDNSGLIQNQLQGGLLLGPKSTLINRATGVITSLTGGNLFYGTSTLTLINYGQINANIGLDGGNNLVTFYTGSSLSGYLSLGSGDSTLTLAGAGTASFNNVTTGVVHLVKTDSGTWTFGAPQATPQTIAVQAGTLFYTAASHAASLSVAAGSVFDSPAAVLPLQTVDNGLVRVSVASGSVGYAGSVSGSGTFEKTGAGTLSISGAGSWAGPTFIDSGTLAAAQANVLPAPGAVVVGPGAALLLQASQEIGAFFGGGTVTLDPSTLTVGANGANGANNANARYDGVIAGDGGLTKVGNAALVLTAANTYTGATAVEAGELAINGSIPSNVSVAAGATLSGPGVIGGNVQNSGTLSAGAHAFTFEVPTVSASGEVGAVTQSLPASLGALTIAGSYSSSGGALALRTVIGNGGPGNQTTDRLLVAGNVAGETLVHVSPENGSVAASTGISPTSGISIIQVGGSAGTSNFALPGGYVAAGPYRMRLVYFGPAQSAASELDSHLASLGVTRFNDFRLQTEDVLDSGTSPANDPSGEPIGGGPDGEHPGEEVLIPQVPAYLAMPTGAIQYATLMLDDLHKRALELWDPLLDTDVAGNPAPYTPTAFFRVKGWTGNSEGDAEPNFHQRIWFMQAGGGVILPGVWQDGDRLDTELVVSQGGSDSTVSINHSGTRFDATGIGVTATYHAVCGAYLDFVTEGLFFTDVGFSTDERGLTGTTSGTGFVTSLESGMPFVVLNWLTFEPRVALSYQADHFKPFTDIDDVNVDPGTASSLQGRVGARVSHIFEIGTPRGALLVEPFATIDYVRALDGHNHETIGGVTFADDAGGTALKYGGGVALRIHERLDAYLSFEHASGRGAPSVTGNEVLGTFRYSF